MSTYLFINMIERRVEQNVCLFRQLRLRGLLPTLILDSVHRLYHRVSISRRCRGRLVFFFQQCERGRSQGVGSAAAAAVALSLIHI